MRARDTIRMIFGRAVLVVVLAGLFSGGLASVASEAEATVTQHYAIAKCNAKSLGSNEIRVVDGIYATRAGDTAYSWIRIWAQPYSGGQWVKVYDSPGWTELKATQPGWVLRDQLFFVSHNYRYHVQVYHGNSRVQPMVYENMLNGISAGTHTSPDSCLL